MSKNQKMTTSDFYCTRCGNKGIPVIRKAGKQREGGHLKKLYCMYCKEEVNHAEVRPFGEYNYEDFKLEFDLGRFLKDGTKIPIGELMLCSNTDCKYNINGRCWNSNYSYNCQHRPNKEENCNE